MPKNARPLPHRGRGQTSRRIFLNQDDSEQTGENMATERSQGFQSPLCSLRFLFNGCLPKMNFRPKCLRWVAIVFGFAAVLPALAEEKAASPDFHFDGSIS